MNEKEAVNRLISHYRILSRIGAGGMGEVYLAQDTRLHRNVALKILPADLAASKDRMRRFEQEAIAAAALNHPNIAHIYEIGEHGNTHFIAMEFIDGQTLGELINSATIDLAKLLRHLQHVAEGLAKAHAAGIVHRDLKPDNIVVSRDGHAKILDFGLAKLIEQQPTSSGDSSGIATAVIPPHSTPGTVIGTVGYMSPEQAQGKTKEIDPRSDIFSFGCILYEAVTRRKAFEGKDAIDSLNKIIREPAAPITDFRPDAPDHLQRIVRRCLAKDPEDRYQTIKDVAIELRELRSELASDAGIDVTVPPARSDAATSAGAKSTSPDSAGSISSSPSVSSAEYVVSAIRRHKLAAAVVFLLLAAGSILLSLILHARSTEVGIESIAVLPFENKSNDADADYLTDGLAESLIYRLSQLPNLKVSPTSSVFRYKGRETDPIGIARELGVNAVMTGRMVKRGDNLTISAELIDARHNKLLWGEQYDRKLADLLATQREIAAEITNKLQLKLSGADEAKVRKDYTTNSEAYQLYLKGRFYWNKRDAENFRKAIEQFEAAAKKDPRFALAFVGLADCYALLPEYGTIPSGEALPQAKAYAERALEIDDLLGEAHISLANVYSLSWNWDEAEREFKRGLELNANYATGHKWHGLNLATLSRYDEALAELKRAQELEPLSMSINLNVADGYFVKGDFNAAVEQCRRTIDLDPNWYYPRQYLGLGYLILGRSAEAVAESEKSVELSKRHSIPLGVLGYIYAQTGKRNEAAAILEELKQRYARQQANGYDIARVYVGLGDRDQAFEWLEKDFLSRSSLLPFWLTSPPLNSLRGDPRFKDLEKRAGMTK